MTRLTAETIRPHQMSGIDRQVWLEFVATEPSLASPYFHPDFTALVGAARSDARVTVFRRSGTAVAFWPHHRRPGRFARPIGAPFSDVHGLVARLDEPISLHQALDLADVAAFRFTGLTDHPAHRRASRQRRFTAQSVLAPRQTGEAFLEERRASAAKHFKKMRRLARQMEKECGPLDVIVDDRVSERFEALIDWKRAQYIASGRHDVLGTDWAQRLMRSLFERTDDALRGQLSTLLVNGRPAAMEYNLRAGAVLHGWIVAYNPEFAKYSPGGMLTEKVIAAMHEHGLRVYDHGGGSNHYAKPYANRTTLLGEGLLVGPSAIGRWSRFKSDVALAMEARAPGRAGHVLGRARRRSDQIAAAEPDLSGRLAGLRRAVSQIAPR